MAIVADLSGNFPPNLLSGIDQRFNDVSRVLTASPQSLGTVPAFAGEIVRETANGPLWVSKGVAVTDWFPVVWKLP